MARIKVYHYPNCSTCKKARRWLDDHGIAHELVDIVSSPPPVATLKRVLRQSGKPLGKLFNTAGQSYRAGNFKDKLPTMTQAQALAALASDGKLIKRPLLVAGDVALVGFRDAEYADALG